MDSWLWIRFVSLMCSGCLMVYLLSVWMLTLSPTCFSWQKHCCDRHLFVCAAGLCHSCQWFTIVDMTNMLLSVFMYVIRPFCAILLFCYFAQANHNEHDLRACCLCRLPFCCSYLCQMALHSVNRASKDMWNSLSESRIHFTYPTACVATWMWTMTS